MSSKTLDLRRLIAEKLGTVTGGTYYRTAPNNAPYPYKVFSLDRVNLADLARDDIDLTVDVWDRGLDPKRVEQIADEIEELFNAANLPQESILPTIFRDSRYPIMDDDKQLQRIQLHFLVQNYTR